MRKRFFLVLAAVLVLGTNAWMQKNAMDLLRGATGIEITCTGVPLNVQKTSPGSAPTQAVDYLEAYSAGNMTTLNYLQPHAPQWKGRSFSLSFTDHPKRSADEAVTISISGTVAADGSKLEDLAAERKTVYRDGRTLTVRLTAKNVAARGTKNWLGSNVFSFELTGDAVAEAVTSVEFSLKNASGGGVQSLSRAKLSEMNDYDRNTFLNRKTKQLAIFFYVKG
jgi:hypothetical protein